MRPSKWLRAILLGAVLVCIGLGVSAGRAQSTASDRAAWPKDIDPDSGNRLPVPKPEEMTAADRKIFQDVLTEDQGGLSAHDKDRPQVRMYSPKFAKGLADAHHYLKYETAMGDRLNLIAEMTTARELTNQFEWTQFEEHARTPGDPRFVEPQIIDAIKYCRPVVGLGEKEAAIITFGRELLGRRRVSSDTFAKVRELFGPRATVELEELFGLYAATCYELTAFDQQLHVSQKPLLQADAAPC